MPEATCRKVKSESADSKSPERKRAKSASSFEAELTAHWKGNDTAWAQKFIDGLNPVDTGKPEPAKWTDTEAGALIALMLLHSDKTMKEVAGLFVGLGIMVTRKTEAQIVTKQRNWGHKQKKNT